MLTFTLIFIWVSLISCGWSKQQEQQKPIFLSYQDSIGQYSFGYSDPMSARSEYRASDGVTRGTYSYIDQNGLIQTAEYEAGKDFGFRVKATNIPVAPQPVQDTPEVMAARAQHLRLIDEANRRMDVPMANGPPNSEPRNLPILPTIAHHLRMDSNVAPAGGGNGVSPTSIPEISARSSIKGNNEPKVKSPEAMDSMQKKMTKDEMKLEMETKLKMEPTKPMLNSMLLPESVTYTPEVMKAREAHFRAYDVAARLATESDVNPMILNELFRRPASGEMLLPSDLGKPDEIKGKTSSDLQDLKATEKKISSEKTMQNSKSDESSKTADKVNVVKGFTPASTSLRIMDVRLPSLNEFQQTKLKAGAYSTPIEVSHIPPRNLLPIIYPTFPGNSGFQYIYL